MNRFEELKNSLEVYRDSADKIISEYTKRDREAKERYNDVTYQTEHSQNVEIYKRRLSESRSKSESRINGIVDDVQADLKRWVTAPVDTQLLNTLTAIKTAGIKLNKSEIQALREKAGGNFIGEKFIAAIALDNGMKIPAANTEQWMKIIQDVKNGAMTLLNGYCGNGYVGKELLEPHYNNGIKYGEKQPPHIIAMAENILKPSSPLFSAIMLWKDGVVPSIEELKPELTEEETAYINSLYVGHNGNTAARTREILSINPALEEKLIISEFAQFCPSFKRNNIK